MAKILDLKTWKQQAKETGKTDDPVRKYLHLEEVKGIEETEDGLKVPFVISTGSVDRDGDTIDPNGWDLTNYRKNPVVLWAHDSWSPPVAKSLEETISDGKLKSIALFTPKDLNPFGYMVGQMYAKGFMRAVSVGFISSEWEWAEDKERPFGIDFKRQELLEYSTVPIPANPEALVDAKSAGIDISPMLEWAVRVLDGEGIWIPKAQAQKIWGELAERKSYFFVGSPHSGIDVAKAKQPKQSEKGVSPSDVSDELAPEDTPWETPTLSDFTDRSWDELSDAEKRRIAEHFAWAAEMPPATFGDLKFPHHRPSDGKIVWRAVANAAARLNQADIPTEDVPKVQAHLARHYRQFGRTPPWEGDNKTLNSKLQKLQLLLFENISKGADLK